MSVEILGGTTGQSVMFCNTSDFAFGPVFHDGEDAEEFLRWLAPTDPRSLSDTDLEGKVSDWRALLEEHTEGDAMVTRSGLFDMQVCVPRQWTDREVVLFAEGKNESGTDNGWQIRKEGDERLLHDPERQACDQRNFFVHIMLDA